MENNNIKNLTFDVILPSGKRVTAVEAVADMYAYEVIDCLIDEELLPPPHIHGFSSMDYYRLVFKEKNQRQLDMDMTLKANGVCNHDILFVAYVDVVSD